MHPNRGGCQAVAHQIEIKKKKKIVYMIAVISRDLPFSQNQPLKSAGDQYVRIFTNKT
jgi:hypothetical protein